MTQQLRFRDPVSVSTTHIRQFTRDLIPPTRFFGHPTCVDNTDRQVDRQTIQINNKQ